ncbi:MAG TPA: NAD(P)-binding protein [Candidatus Limnocylindrales bacterium]|nr:NAD(P)-binding protein [Candidatus Limnocylindrales bacterium]
MKYEDRDLDRDRALGMDRRITRRDFLNGFSVAVGGSLLAPCAASLTPFGSPASVFDLEKGGAYYPPALTGMRGSTDAVMRVGHSLRDGKKWSAPKPDRASYDLIVVGGGISGLSAAYFFRKLAGPNAKILILENHDDFGGHARRNEFTAPGRTLIGYGGTQSIAGPKGYSKEAIGLLRELGIDVQRFYKYFDRSFDRSQGLSRAIFFDKETFGVDRLVPGRGSLPWSEFFARTPLSPAAKKDLVRLHTAKVDYLPNLSPADKKILLSKTSYKEFLLKYVKVDPSVIPFLQKETYGLYGVGVEAVPAGDLAGLGYPAFQGIDLSGPDGPGLGVEVTKQSLDEPYIFHFPDGNASIARLLVRSLIPSTAPGHTMEDIVTAKLDYARLDDAASPVRVRLNSTVIHTHNVDDSANAREVEVVYIRNGEAHSVRGSACILACWNMVIPYMCPEMSEKQRDALHYGVKVPLVYTNVQIRNWQAFKKLGISGVSCPGGYFDSVALDFPVSMGEYHFPSNPDDSCLLHMEHIPCSPGLSARDQQIAGRQELLTTTFETFERHIRSQLARILSPGGFNPASDIQAVTVNRWPHGYAYEYNSLYDPIWPPEQQPCVIARQPFGRISIANSDAEARAYTDAAINQAYRAVGEVARFTKTGAARA